MNFDRARPALAATVVSGVLAMAGCGDDGDTSTGAEQSVTPETAIAEVEETQSGLTDALATYSSGDDAAAADQATETYLQHFELVEGPLEEVDPELTEELEEMIREELVGAMEAGDPVPEVTALVDEIDAGLDDAAKQLQGS